MPNRETVKEWIAFAEMDFNAALHLHEKMTPEPREIVCYHCEQAIEKMLKAALIANGENIKKTHDLGLLIEQLQHYYQVSEQYMSMCDNLTPYGVKIRYPQELFIEEHHVRKALEDTKALFGWLKTVLVDYC